MARRMTNGRNEWEEFISGHNLGDEPLILTRIYSCRSLELFNIEN